MAGSLFPNTLRSYLRSPYLPLKSIHPSVHNQLHYFSHARSNPNSVNPSEVTHFNSLASTWWDLHGPSRLLHLMNPHRHDFIARCHASQSDALPIDHKLHFLDVGCGGGIFAESAARLSTVQTVTAIDPSPDVLAIAKAHARRDPVLQGKLFYRNTPIEDFPKPVSVAEQYDVLTLFEVIEHITYPAAFLEQCIKFVKPGGWIIMSTIARSWLSWITTIAIAEYGIRLVPPGTHDWGKYINPDELRSWFLKKKGWSSPTISGVIYIPGIGWKQVNGSEMVGNYFFGIRRNQ